MNGRLTSPCCEESTATDRAGVDDAMIERIRAGGQKIREASARAMFPEIETMKLRYRK